MVWILKDGWQQKSTSHGKVEFSLCLSVLPKRIKIFLKPPPLSFPIALHLADVYWICQESFYTCQSCAHQVQLSTEREWSCWSFQVGSQFRETLTRLLGRSLKITQPIMRCHHFCTMLYFGMTLVTKYSQKYLRLFSCPPSALSCKIFLGP